MGRKKKRDSGDQPVVKIIPRPGSITPDQERKVTASPEVILALGCVGAVLGFLSGLNLWPSVPTELTSIIANAGWLGAVLGQQHLDYQMAGQGLFLGLSIGLGTAFSFNLPMRKMVLTWILAGGGLLAGVMLTKTVVAAAAGWVGGLILAQVTPA